MLTEHSSGEWSSSHIHDIIPQKTSTTPIHSGGGGSRSSSATNLQNLNLKKRKQPFQFKVDNGSSFSCNDLSIFEGTNFDFKFNSSAHKIHTIPVTADSTTIATSLRNNTIMSSRKSVSNNSTPTNNNIINNNNNTNTSTTTNATTLNPTPITTTTTTTAPTISQQLPKSSFTFNTTDFVNSKSTISSSLPPTTTIPTLPIIASSSNTTTNTNTNKALGFNFDMSNFDSIGLTQQQPTTSNQLMLDNTNNINTQQPTNTTTTVNNNTNTTNNNNGFSFNFQPNSVQSLVFQSSQTNVSLPNFVFPKIGGAPSTANQVVTIPTAPIAQSQSRRTSQSSTSDFHQLTNPNPNPTPTTINNRTAVTRVQSLGLATAAEDSSSSGPLGLGPTIATSYTPTPGGQVTQVVVSTNSSNHQQTTTTTTTTTNNTPQLNTFVVDSAKSTPHLTVLQTTSLTPLTTSTISSESNPFSEGPNKRRRVTIEPRRQIAFQMETATTTAVCVPGHKDLEDRLKIVESLEMVSPELGHISFVGVYDGHGGSGASDFVQQHLWWEIAVNPLFRKGLYREALLDGFKAVDEKFLTQARSSFDSSGACTLVLIGIRTPGTSALSTHCSSMKLIVANAGDCRAILCPHQGDAIPLSRDHKVSDPEERKRLDEAGAFVRDNKLFGMLHISRAIGDRDFKTALKPGGLPPVLSVPEIMEIDVDLDVHSFVVLGSDGVWDVMSNNEVQDMVRTHLKARKQNPSHTLQACAEAIIDESIRRGSRDDVSVVIRVL